MNMNYSQPNIHNEYALPPLHSLLCNIQIRAYYFFTISTPHLYHRHTLIQSLGYYHPLRYPYTWFVYGDQAAIINLIDIRSYYYQIHQQPDNEANEANDDDDDDDDVDVSDLPYPNLIFDNEDVILQDQINESFLEAADFNADSGLTKEVISENLNVEKYMNLCEDEEDEEICVICQVGFEKDETIGVVECKHRYHAECIQQWLIYKNVCPLCNAQALTI